MEEGKLWGVHFTAKGWRVGSIVVNSQSFPGDVCSFLREGQVRVWQFPGKPYAWSPWMQKQSPEERWFPQTGHPRYQIFYLIDK
jgi:hypothetical protein